MAGVLFPYFFLPFFWFFSLFLGFGEAAGMEKQKARMGGLGS
jgi:hypothetical protein